MKIADSAISLYSERTAFEAHQKRESLTVWRGDEDPRVNRGSRGRGQRFDPAKEIDRMRHSDRVSLRHHRAVQQRMVQPAEVEVTEDQKMAADLNMRLLQAFFERITGRKFQTVDPVKVSGQQAAEVVVNGQNPESVPPPTEESEGFGLIYDYHESHYEYEKTDFKAGGVITTSDGREIDFSMSLSMSREFYSEQNLHVRAGDALKDPLVINFSGTAAQLGQRNFQFDIDADGHKDQIAFVGPGSGFLALDKNGDGAINDGSELFGALSGNGFQDLSRYDSDGNNWIDENDAIYENLRIWSKNSDGKDQLVALGQAGVGALYLGHIESLFNIKDTENELLGQVRSTGLAVMESGQTVTMQQLDLVA